MREVMTQEVEYCFVDEDTAHVAKNMGELADPPPPRASIATSAWSACRRGPTSLPHENGRPPGRQCPARDRPAGR